MSWSDVRLVVFDLDGTLVDSVGDLARAVNDALARLAPGAETLPLESVRTFIGNGARKLMTRSLDAARIEIDVEATLPTFLDCYRARMLETTRLYPGVTEALERLSDRPLAVLTNKPGEMSRTILEALGVAACFFRILGGGDGLAIKPDPAGLRVLMAEAGALAEQTAMVGDSAIDVDTGRAAGARTVGVTYGFAPESLRAAPPDLLVDDLRRLAQLIRPLPDAAVLG
jgi:phosphoglycolate phosphatase